MIAKGAWAAAASGLAMLAQAGAADANDLGLKDGLKETPMYFGGVTIQVPETNQFLFAAGGIVTKTPEDRLGDVPGVKGPGHYARLHVQSYNVPGLAVVADGLIGKQADPSLARAQVKLEYKVRF